MGDKKDEITKLDLYDLIGVSYDANTKEIKTAYRKKALTCHPDKNPDNPAAAQLFHQLSRALEILVDGAAKAAYDKILQARKAAAIRTSQLDSKRRKLIEDLETRERAAEQSREEESPVDAAKKLQIEIERLRKEGSRQLEEEIVIMEKQLKEEKSRLVSNDETAAKLSQLSVKWKEDKQSPAPYTEDSLLTIFNKYGHVSALVIRNIRNRCRCIVEFSNPSAAEAAISQEKGVPEYPLQVTWLNKPSATSSFMSSPAAHSTKTQDSSSTDRDYESMVMMRLRQAEERKRLAQQMMDDDKCS